MSEPEELAERAQLLTALLRHFDWSPAAKVPGQYEVWQSREDSDDVLVPVDPTKGDYDVLLDRAFRLTMQLHGQEAVRLRDLLTLEQRSALDSTQWKKDTPVNAGLIGWDEGESLYAAARASLAAAAKSARESRMYHGNANSHVAKRFLDGSFMGQTEVGSFIITAHTPSADRFHLSKASEDNPTRDPRKSETITGRAIIERFASAIEAVRSGLDEFKKTPSTEVFVELVPHGVSFELAKALSDLSSNGDAGVQVKYFSSKEVSRWSSEIVFESVESRVLEQVATRFAQGREPEDVSIVGEVTLLNHASATTVHLIRLDVESGADIRRARVRLTPEQYKLAVEAHASGAFLAVSGRLEREGNIYWVYGADRVRLVEPTPDRPDSSLEQLAGFEAL